MKNATLHSGLRDRAARAEMVTAVCTGSMLLSSAGLLDGLDATTHWRFLDGMRDTFPAVKVKYRPAVPCRDATLPASVLMS
jgi:transcriptional regulator GlxA family with amidase domain